MCSYECGAPQRPSFIDQPLASTLFSSFASFLSSSAPVIHRRMEKKFEEGEEEEDEGVDQTHGSLKKRGRNPIKDRRRRKCRQSDDCLTKGNCNTSSKTRCLCITGKKYKSAEGCTDCITALWVIGLSSKCNSSLG